MVTATKIQTDIMNALESLGFAPQPDESDVVGGPMKLAANDEALDALKGKTVTVDSDGSVAVG